MTLLVPGTWYSVQVPGKRKSHRLLATATFSWILSTRLTREQIPAVLVLVLVTSTCTYPPTVHVPSPNLLVQVPVVFLCCISWTCQTKLRSLTVNDCFGLIEQCWSDLIKDGIKNVLFHDKQNVWFDPRLLQLQVSPSPHNLHLAPST